MRLGLDELTGFIHKICADYFSEPLSSMTSLVTLLNYTN